MNFYSPLQDIQADNQIYYVDQAPKSNPETTYHQNLNTQPKNDQIIHQHHKIGDEIMIQPYLSDQYCISHPQQYNYQNPSAKPGELDLHLIKEEDMFLRYTLKAQSDEVHLHHTASPATLEYALPRVQEDGRVYQIIDQTSQHPTYPEVQVDHTHSPYITHQEHQQIYLPEVHQNEIIFLPAIEIQNDQPIYQTEHYQLPSTKVEPQVPTTMEFIKKGPRGEVLYKVKEGTVNYYVKRGLTPEAVYNYQLAHTIGVGPPVETIESDGLRMEEGLCLRQAVREKIITVEDAFKQIQMLHQMLFDAGMAHCDVKFENCLYFPRHERVLLIDNGDLSAYGNPRKIKTEGTNSTLLISPYGHDAKNKVGPATDLQGFIHIMFNAVHGPLS